MSRLSSGLIWMVISREIWLSQLAAVERTMLTPPSVRQARKAMIDITTIKALPWMLDGGRIGAVGRTRISGRFCSVLAGALSGFLDGGSVIDIEMPPREDHTAGFHLFHQRQVMRGDHNGCAEAVQLKEKI